MRHRLPILLASTAAMAALPATAETRTYTVPDFDSIDVSAGIKVIFETGVTPSVAVENDMGDFSDILVENDHGELKLERPTKLRWGGKRPSYTVRVGVQLLSGIEASSGASVEGAGLSGSDVTVDVSSGARAVISGISARFLEARASSGSDMILSGTCTELDVKASSGASIKADDVKCASVDGDVSSGASIRAYASETVTAEASSGGNLRVVGGATNVTIDKSSGGSVSVG